MGTLAGTLRVSESSSSSTTSVSAASAAAVAAQEADFVNKNKVWGAMDQLARWNDAGHIPTAAELSALGVALPAFFSK